MDGSVLLMLSLLLAAFADATVSAGAEPRDEVWFCQPSVPEEVARANATFSVVYQLEIGPNGRPQSLTKLVNPYLDDEQFIQCLSKWVLPVKNRRITVAFRWQHGVGWTEVLISGTDTPRRLILNESR